MSDFIRILNAYKIVKPLTTFVDFIESNSRNLIYFPFITLTISIGFTMENSRSQWEVS